MAQPALRRRGIAVGAKWMTCENCGSNTVFLTFGDSEQEARNALADQFGLQTTSNGSRTWVSGVDALPASRQIKK